MKTTPFSAPSADTRRAAALTQLRHFLKTRVAPFSPYYRRLFQEAGFEPAHLRTPEDWACVPFTTKNELAAQPRDFVLTPEAAILKRQPGTLWRALTHGPRAVAKAMEREFRPLLLTSTTGRSAPPVPFLHTAYDLANLQLAGRRLMEIGGSQREWRHLNLFPYAPHLAFWQAHYASIGFGCFCVGSGGGKVMNTEATLSLIDKIKPEVIIAMPTFLYHVLRQAVTAGKEWPHLRKLVLGGEKAPPGLRRKLAELSAELGSPRVDVLATYGFTEAKMAWIECPAAGERSGYHLLPELGYVEIVDPDTGALLPDGQPGEIVFSALDCRGTVVLRYRTGDHIDGGLTYEPCPHCHWTGPRLVGSISRVSEKRRLDIAKLKGTLVDFNALELVLDDLEGLGAWQIELRKLGDDPYERDELIVHASSRAGADRSDLERAISRRFFDTAEIRPNRVVWHSDEELQELHGVGRSLKEQKIVDHRPPVPTSASSSAALTR